MRVWENKKRTEDIKKNKGKKHGAPPTPATWILSYYITKYYQLQTIVTYGLWIAKKVFKNIFGVTN